MANYYCQFCTLVKAPVEALDWLEQKLAGKFDKDDDDWEDPPCEFERNKTDATELWVGTEDDCDLDRLAKAVCEMQTRFSVHEPWSMSWANTCPDPDADGLGGVIVCYKGKTTSMNTAVWEDETIARLLKEDSDSKGEAGQATTPDNSQ